MEISYSNWKASFWDRLTKRGVKVEGADKIVTITAFNKAARSMNQAVVRCPDETLATHLHLGLAKTIKDPVKANAVGQDVIERRLKPNDLLRTAVTYNRDANLYFGIGGPR